MFKCPQCGRSFASKRSLASHRNWEKGKCTAYRKGKTHVELYGKKRAAEIHEKVIAAWTPERRLRQSETAKTKWPLERRLKQSRISSKNIRILWKRWHVEKPLSKREKYFVHIVLGNGWTHQKYSWIENNGLHKHPKDLPDSFTHEELVWDARMIYDPWLGEVINLSKSSRHLQGEVLYDSKGTGSLQQLPISEQFTLPK